MGADSAPPHRGGQDPCRQADLLDCIERLLQLVEELPLSQRQACLLRYEADMTLAGLAATLDTGAKTARCRLRYAMQRLRAGLPGQCPEEHGDE